MPYNETFEKLKAAQNPAFAEEIEAVKDNQTFFIGAYESSPEGNTPKGDFNEIFQALLNNDKALKKLAEAIQARTITAGKGLQGGGALSKDVTLNVVSVNDAIIVNDNNIQLNPVNDLTTGGADKAGSAEMVKKLGEDKQNKTDSGLQTESKEIVGAINESLWHTKPKSVGNTSTQSDLNDLTDLGFYRSQSANNLWLNLPNNLTKASFFLEVIGDNVEYGVIHQIISFTVKNTRYIRWGTKNTSGMGKPNKWGEWQEILTSDSRLFLGNSGISKVVYIQDEGTKTQGQGYIDKSTGQVYLCLETNTDTTITNKFMSITNVELGKKVESSFWKLNPKVITDTNFDILGVYEAGFYSALSDEAQKNWINKPYIGSLCYGLLYQNQLHNRRSVLYIDITGRIYSNTQTTSGTPMSWTGWKKEVIDADIVDNLTTSDKSKVLSANMGVKLNTSGYDGQGRGTLRNNSLNIDQIKKSGAWYIYDKNLKPFIGFDYAYLQHIQYNDNDVGAWQLMCPDNKLELYTRVCAGKSGRYTDWEQILTSNNKLFLGNAGISKVIYIQDAGQKTAGNGYVDKTTGQLYLCKVTNSDTSVTSNFVLATNIEIAKRQHFTKTILFDKPTGHGNGDITLSDNWENYDEFIVYGSGDNADYVGSCRFKKEDIEYSISKGQRYLIYTGIRDYWLARITTGSKTWVSGREWENSTIFRIIGIKYGG